MTLRALVATLFFVFSFLHIAQAEEGSRVVLVLDASGSMRGKIDGKSKMDIAKQVVSKIVGNWNATDELGLVAYGHREKGSCADIEVLREASKLDADAYMKSVRGLNPKGKTPLTAAVKMAAESLQYTEKNATVILVSDGIETCDLDPCAVATDLEKLGVGLTVHTVGFGLEDKGAVAQLKCLAENTGGTFSTASNADELLKALAKTVAKQPEQKAEVIENNFIGHVVMAEGVELPEKFNDPTWSIYENRNGERGKQLGTEYTADVKFNIEKPGDYFVSIVQKQAEVLMPFKIEMGKVTKMTANLNAGVLKLAGFMDEQTAIADGSWDLINSKNSERLTSEYGPTVQLFAAAGKYKVGLTVGQSHLEQEFEFVAGKSIEEKLSLGAGVIEVSAVFSEGGDVVPEGAAIELREGKPDIEGKYKWLTTDYKSPSKFSATAGVYRVSVKQDYAEATTMVDLKSGSIAQVKVNLNAGYLALTSAGAQTFEVYLAKKKLDGTRELLATEYGESINKAFNIGIYHVVIYGENSVILNEKDFEIKAGERTEASVP
jgi:Ca-activated chloride channel homolog